VAIFDLHVGLRVLAILAQDESGDEAIKRILQLGSFVCSVNDPAVIGCAIVGLCAKFEAEVFDDVCVCKLVFDQQLEDV